VLLAKYSYSDLAQQILDRPRTGQPKYMTIS
jgi:hypothetical protein